MSRPQIYFEWSDLNETAGGAIVGTRQRLRWILVLFGVALAIVFVRAMQLEFSDGAEFRRLAAKPLERTIELSAPRGRILARDGTVLAADREATALAVQFRYLENPPNPAWLRGLARARLPRAERRNTRQLAAMEDLLRQELSDLRSRLAELCEMSPDEWQARATRIARRVDAMALRVNQRRLEIHQANAANQSPGDDSSLTTIVAGMFAPPDDLPLVPLVIAEQTAFHRVVDDVPEAVVAEIEANAQRYPGVKIVEYTRRGYPLGSTASHLVGHVAARSGADSTVVPGQFEHSRPEPIGLMGIERRYEAILCGQRGLAVQAMDRRGKVLSSAHEREPTAGGDVVLTIDPRLQLAAENLLDRAIRRRDPKGQHGDNANSGGSIAVMDVSSGEILAAASAPRFDPNLLASGDARIESVLVDPRQPLFDRVSKMALPPGSVFKSLTAIAILESGVAEPSATFRCQGYFDDPDRLRCQLFRQHGIGHGDVTLADALAQSCNVYFFHHALDLGATRLLDWATRFGFGQPTGIDLDDEQTGRLPTAAEVRQQSQAQMLAVGQGAIAVTPLQILRMYAAIANGGRLVTPRVLAHSDVDGSTLRNHSQVTGLGQSSLAAVREGLRRTVEDPNGTAYGTVRLANLPIAGKTGTAQTGSNSEDHAWFAGYAPADAPRYAFVVVLEHGGSGAAAAGSLARDVVQRMQHLGYFAAIETARGGSSAQR